MKVAVASVALVVVVGLGAGESLAGNWQVRRNSHGVCSLQPSDAVPLLGRLLDKKPSKREACEAAKSRGVQAPSDGIRCVGYTPNTGKVCRSEGVKLRE